MLGNMHAKHMQEKGTLIPSTENGGKTVKDKNYKFTMRACVHTYNYTQKRQMVIKLKLLEYALIEWNTR